MTGSGDDAGVLREAPLVEIEPATLYQILALRAAVFVVEQDCAYLDPDGRDLEPSAVQLWVERDHAVLATCRLLRDPDGAARIGRVATAAGARRLGLAEQLVRRAVTLAGAGEVVLDAQAYLQRWYERLGFERCGDDFVEDGIAHLPMRRRG